MLGRSLLFLSCCFGGVFADNSTGDQRGECAPPVIMQNPESAEPCEGEALTLTVGADEAIGYQWRKDGIDLTGATEAAYSLSNVALTDSGQYTCLVIGNCGSVATEPATLSVLGEITISGTRTVFEECGGTRQFLSVGNVTPIGDYTYQWRKGGVEIPGATEYAYEIVSLSTADEGQYTCLVSNGCFVEETRTIFVVVTPQGVITGHPQDLLMCGGTSFLIGSFNTGPTSGSHWWEKDGVVIPETISTAKTLPYFYLAIPTEEGVEGEYRFIVNTTCNIVYSNIATVVLGAYAEITQHLPPEMAICEGDDLFLEVETVRDAQMSFQWYKDGSILSGEEAASLSRENLSPQDSGEYSCVINGSCMPSSDQTTTQLTVLSPLEVTVQPEDLSLCVNTPLLLSTQVNDPWATFQWTRNGAPIPGATSATLNIDQVNPTDSGVYQCQVTGTCGAVITNEAEIFVDQSGPYNLKLDHSIIGLGTNAPFFNVLMDCVTDDTNVTWRHEDGTILGDGSNLVITQTPTETTSYFAEIFGLNLPGNQVILEAVVLVSQNPVIRDPNGDGCSSPEDLYTAAQDWVGDDDFFDADGNGSVDVRDLLYINTQFQACGQ